MMTLSFSSDISSQFSDATVWIQEDYHYWFSVSVHAVDDLWSLHHKNVS